MSLSDEVQDLENENDELQDTINTLETKIMELESRNDELESDIFDLNEELAKK